MTWKRILLAAIGLVFAMGCSDRTSRRFVFEPEPGAFTLSGRVQIIQALTAELGDSLGYARIEDASGIRVRLTGPDGATDSTLSRDGAFEFHVDAPGHYRVACALFPEETLCTAQVDLVDEDIAFPDTLVFDHVRLVNTFPNPFPSAHGLAIETTIPTAQSVRIVVKNLAGETIFDDALNWPAGVFHYHWPGLDDSAQPVPNGLYWVCIGFDGANHVEIVRKE